VILASGAFDGLHAGHVRYLRAAYDVDPYHKLFVAIAPDVYVEQEKLRRVFWTQSERAKTVQHVREVDGVIEHTEITPAEVIRSMKPKYFVKGEDWIDKLPKDVVRACKEVGAEIVFVKAAGTHTSDARTV
jgi:cytidyltransferase-like protein